MTVLDPPAARSTGVDVLAVVVWSVGGLVLPVIGWLVGVVLVFSSPVFRRSDRLLSLFAPPFGLGPVVLVGAAGLFARGCSQEFEQAPDGQQRLISSTCDGGPTLVQVAAVLAVVGLVGLAVFTTLRLARRVAATR